MPLFEQVREAVSLRSRSRSRWDLFPSACRWPCPFVFSWPSYLQSHNPRSRHLWLHQENFFMSLFRQQQVGPLQMVCFSMLHFQNTHTRVPEGNLLLAFLNRSAVPPSVSFSASFHSCRNQMPLNFFCNTVPFIEMSTSAFKLDCKLPRLK